MKLKFFIFSLVLLASSFSVNAQKVKFKKGDVLVDGEKIFTYEKQNLGNTISIYTLDDNTEVLYMNFDDGGTLHYHDDNFMAMNFLIENVKIETSNFNGRGFKYILGQMIKQGVISKNGEIVPEKLEIFSNKYDESITDRTIINR
ncbi:hypothetical protein [Mesonia sp.]|uniref:hypothetical protein n=1 Tax=Mesonia sp. TaxID=1960830 RepID=UPI0017796F53|nr:hypothetical protein [Mesonia sp.]HIB37781.1 hypothetical protein [Mesonia sp.]